MKLSVLLLIAWVFGCVMQLWFLLLECEIACVEIVDGNCECVVVLSVKSMDLILWEISIVVTGYECMSVFGFNCFYQLCMVGCMVCVNGVWVWCYWVFYDLNWEINL